METVGAETGLDLETHIRNRRPSDDKEIRGPRALRIAFTRRLRSFDRGCSRRANPCKDSRLATAAGRRARQTATKRFLLSRLAEDWIDLIGSLVEARQCVSPK